MDNEWKPINFKGTWASDPRDELDARIVHALEARDTYVSIPIPLARALVTLRECDSTTISTGDEDGPFKTPIQIKCRLMKNHLHRHGNGYTSWE